MGITGLEGYMAHSGGGRQVVLGQAAAGHRAQVRQLWNTLCSVLSGRSARCCAASPACTCSALCRSAHLVLSYVWGLQYTRLCVVLDGHSCLYWVVQLREARMLGPNLLAGQQIHYTRCWLQLVRHLRGLGLEPLVVFDGPRPLSKRATHIARAQQQHRALLASWQHALENGANDAAQPAVNLLPCLALELAQAALGALGVEWHVADGEGDWEAAQLCLTRQGLGVVARDNDYFAIPVPYLPLPQLALDFSQPRFSRAVLYPADSLATALSLQPALLPVLSCLLGNDLTLPAAPWLESFHTRLLRTRSNKQGAAKTNKKRQKGLSSSRAHLVERMAEILQAAFSALLLQPYQSHASRLTG